MILHDGGDANVTSHGTALLWLHLEEAEESAPEPKGRKKVAVVLSVFDAAALSSKLLEHASSASAHRALSEEQRRALARAANAVKVLEQALADT